MSEQHDAFRAQRKSALYWIRTSAEELATLDRLEDILPSFVRRRYHITGTNRNGELAPPRGSLTLQPVDIPKDNVAAADTLHADVGKLYDYLLLKCQDNSGEPPPRPARTLVAYSGLIGYEFTLAGLPGFEGGLRVNINGLPAGSACHITKIVKGSRVVEDVEYEMVCDDDEPGISPGERAEEAEREAVGP